MGCGVGKQMQQWQLQGQSDTLCLACKLSLLIIQFELKMSLSDRSLLLLQVSM